MGIYKQPAASAPYDRGDTHLFLKWLNVVQVNMCIPEGVYQISRL